MMWLHVVLYELRLLVICCASQLCASQLCARQFFSGGVWYVFILLSAEGFIH